MKWITRFLVLSVVTTACSGSGSTTDPSPATPQPGRVEFSVSPTSVSYAGGIGVGGAICPFGFPSRWGPFVWTIKETNGTAVTITSFKYENFTMAGASLGDSEAIAGMALEFTGTAAPTLRLAARSSLSSRPHYDCQSERDTRNFPGGTAVFTVTGTDENGGAVSSTATLNLLPY